MGRSVMGALVPADVQVLPAATAKKLDASATKIRKLMRNTASDIVSIGNELIAAKALLPHGEFGKWIEKEFGWSYTSAAKMVQVAEAFGNLERVRDLTIDVKALYLLSADSCPEDATAEAIQRAEDGEHITHKLAKEIRDKHCEKIAKESDERTSKRKVKALPAPEFFSSDECSGELINWYQRWIEVVRTRDQASELCQLLDDMSVMIAKWKEQLNDN